MGPVVCLQLPFLVGAVRRLGPVACFAIPGGRVGRGIGRVSLGVGFAERLVALEVVAVRVLAGGDASPGVIADLPGDLDAAGSQLLDGRL